MQNCKTCANKVYDERWGDYRCKVYQHRIRNVDRYLDCENYESKQWKKEKKNEE